MAIGGQSLGFGFGGAGGSGTAYITSVSAPLVVTAGVLSINGAGPGTCGVVSLATQAQTYVGSPASAGGCYLVPSITNLLLRRSSPQFALFTQAAGSVPNARGLLALDFQTGRSAITQVASGAKSIAIGYGNTSNQANAISIGQGCGGNGQRSIAMGYYTTGSGYDSVTIGSICGGLAQLTTAIGARGVFSASVSSVSLGTLLNQTGSTINFATGIHSGAAGNAGNGIASTTVGIYSQAQTNLSQVFGLASFTKTNVGGTAMGILNNQSGATLTRTTGAITGTVVAAVSGRNSTAHGIYNIALGHQSVAIGNSCFSAAYTSCAIGILNNTSGASFNSGTGVFSGTIVASTVGISSSSVGIINVASGIRGVAFGIGNTASATDATAVGNSVTASGQNAIAVGLNSTANTTNAIAIGMTCVASANPSVAIGTSCTAAAVASLVAGNGNTATAGSTAAMCLGHRVFSSATSVSSIGVGNLINQTGGTISFATGAIAGSSSSTTTGIASTTVGLYSNAQTTASVAMGNACFTKTGATGVAVGICNNASGQTVNATTGAISGTIVAGVSGINSSCLGVNNIAAGLRGTAIGFGASAAAQDSIAINGTTTATGQMVIGGAYSIMSVFIGNGVTNAAAASVTINATGGSGADNAGAVLGLAGGRPTGTGAGGNVLIQTAPSGATSSTAQTLVDREIIVAKGKALVDNTSVGILTLSLPNNSSGGFIVEWTIRVTNGTDYQSLSGIDICDGVNKAGTITFVCTTIPSAGAAVSGGTLSGVTSLSAVGGNSIRWEMLADTSLTPSGTNSFVLYYRVKNNSQQSITIL